MTAPVIAVTGADKMLSTAWWFIRWHLKRHGAHPVHMTPRNPLPVTRIDGVVISGGDDIDSGLYLHNDEDVAPMDATRDQFEIEVLKYVLETDVPILGICRGAQLLNVVLGGSLHSDLRPIRNKTSNRRTPFARKTLLVEPETQLAQLIGKQRARINSLHHQAIRDLGDGLVVSGRDLDGIVQAVEHPGRRLMIGTQWHPEYLPRHKEQRAIFGALCSAARVVAERR